MAVKKNDQAVKRPIGRPSSYKPEFCDLLIEHQSEGLSFESFGGRPDVSVWKDVLYDWVQKYPDFSNAKKRAEIACLLFWEKLGIDRCTGKLAQGCLGSYVFNMKNRFKWSDQREIKTEITGQVSGIEDFLKKTQDKEKVID